MLWFFTKQDREIWEELSSGCKVELIVNIDFCRYTFRSVCLCGYFLRLCSAVFFSLGYWLLYALTKQNKKKTKTHTLQMWLHLFWTGLNWTTMDLALRAAVTSGFGRPACELMRINSWPLWWPSSVIEMYGHRLLHAYSSNPQTVPDRYTKASSV